MSAEVIALIVLVLVFVVASVRSVNMGALALVAAAVVGATVYDVGPTQVLSGLTTTQALISGVSTPCSPAASAKGI